MTLNAALWASSTALTGKAALALWAAALLFQYFDRRKLAIVWQILITLSTLLLSAAASVYANNTVTKSVWIAGSVMAVLVASMHLRDWLRTSPRETFEESSQVDPKIKKKKKPASSASANAAATLSPSRPSLLPQSLVHWISWIGLLLSGWSVTSSVVASGSVRSSAWFAAVHVLAACLLLGVTVFCAVELTVGSAPSSLSAVSWSSVAFVAMIFWVVEIAIAATIVLAPVEDDADFQALAVSRMFAISLLLMDFVVWMIPHRLATFQRTGQSTAWVSLALAAWIGVLSLTVLCALPAHWPWR